jgi:hypothetical protein
VKGFTRTSTRNSWLVAPALWLLGAVNPGYGMEDPPQLPGDAPDGNGRQDEELDEVLVSGARRVRSEQGLAAWLNRLIGQFSYEGFVELESDGAPRGRQPVNGASKCVAFGPAVHCVVQAVWPEVRGSNGEALPGGVSTLAPAMIMYGADVNFMAIHSQQVDNRGVADSGLGYLQGNVLTTITECMDFPGECRRTSRVNARPDGKLIRMQIDIEQDSKRMVRYSFVLRRLPQAEVGQAAGAVR